MHRCAGPQIVPEVLGQVGAHRTLAPFSKLYRVLLPSVACISLSSKWHGVRKECMYAKAVCMHAKKVAVGQSAAGRQRCGCSSRAGAAVAPAESQAPGAVGCGHLHGLQRCSSFRLCLLTYCLTRCLCYNLESYPIPGNPSSCPIPSCRDLLPDKVPLLTPYILPKT